MRVAWSRCSAELPETAKLCLECGAQVGPRTCPACGAPVERGRFRGECGAPLETKQIDRLARGDGGPEPEAGLRGAVAALDRWGAVPHRGANAWLTRLDLVDSHRAGATSTPSSA